MIFVTMFAILFLIFIYIQLSDLLNPGFVSVFDQYLFREPFYNSSYIVNFLEKRNIRDGLFGPLTTEVLCFNDTLKFTYSPFWVAVDRWLLAILLIAMILLAVNRVLVLMKKMPEYIADIPVYAMVILSIGGYYLSVITLGRYVPEKASFHTYVLLLIIFAVSVIVFGIFRKKSVDKVNDPEDKEKRKKKMTFMTIVAIVQVLLFLIVPCKFMIDAIKVSNDYKPNYGSFNPQKMKVRYDLEKNGLAGNFANQAVDTDDGLYFIEKDWLEDCDDSKDYNTFIRKLNENGNITDICQAKRDDEKHTTDYINIGFADGYLYASTWYSVFRIDPMDGSEVEVISAKDNYYMAEMCVVDNKLYYMEHPEGSSDANSFVWVCEIEGANLSEPELYIGKLDRSIFANFERFDSSYLLTNVVIGDYNDFYYSFGGRFQKYDGKLYYLMSGNRSGNDFVTSSLKIWDESDNREKITIDKVGGFNLYNDSIYFVQLKENGFDVCKCDLDGSNIEVLDTYICDKDFTQNEDQSVFRVMIGQGNIYVSAFGRYYYGNDYNDRFLEMNFVTELK